MQWIGEASPIYRSLKAISRALFMVSTRLLVRGPLELGPVRARVVGWLLPDLSPFGCEALRLPGQFLPGQYDRELWELAGKVQGRVEAIERAAGQLGAKDCDCHEEEGGHHPLVRQAQYSWHRGSCSGLLRLEQRAIGGLGARLDGAREAALAGISVFTRALKRPRPASWLLWKLDALPRSVELAAGRRLAIEACEELDAGIDALIFAARGRLAVVDNPNAGIRLAGDCEDFLQEIKAPPPPG